MKLLDDFEDSTAKLARFRGMLFQHSEVSLMHEKAKEALVAYIKSLEENQT